ncbi:hypothetical protein FPV16_13345 [Methylobacterium sp. W2]|uniref:hypothetical protein n=1 Tax=Methylobacterium sp. W2 TaxID=2598107 RepID=UPI001D0BFD07|nr:hypothetical protein [Methylobacterium sp. W2]MCC0807205.1 hypothetical protein [Methylobacterium sp. W2]
MNEHHKHASVGVAQAIFDGMPSADRARVEAEAASKGVSALEIVRQSLDILIADAKPATNERGGAGSAR